MQGMNIVKSLGKHLSKLVLVGVSAYCLFYAVAFVRLYFMEHPYRVASRWMYENIPAGSTIMEPHWDDKVPVGLDGFSGSRFKMAGQAYELPVYERDTPRIRTLLTSRLHEADYLAFATPRAIDSIPRIPDEYPSTTALLRLLWGEKLGYRLVYATKNRPNLFGLSFNDDLADESFSVYDHPKVVVFQNVERLSQEELERRILSVQDYEPLPTMNDMLLMDKGGWKPSVSFWQPAWSVYLQVLGVLLVLATSFAILLRGVLSKISSRTLLSIAPCGGVALMFGVLYVGFQLALVTYTKEGAVLVVALLAMLAVARFVLSSEVRHRFLKDLRDGGGAIVQAVCLSAVAVFVLLGLRNGQLAVSDYVEQAYLWYVAQAHALPTAGLFTSADSNVFSHADRVMLGSLLKIFGETSVPITSLAYLVAGVIVGGLVHGVVCLFVRSSLKSVVATTLVLVPVLYLGFLQREKVNVRMGAKFSLEQARIFSNLGHWFSGEVQGAPTVAMSCAELSAVSFAGTPSRLLTAESGELSCETVEPKRLYDQLMREGIEFYVTEVDVGSTRSASGTMLESRPDLFAKAYDREGIAVYTPSFSSYFSRYSQES